MPKEQKVIILRINEEKGVHSVSPLKLTQILKDQVGDQVGLKWPKF